MVLNTPPGTPVGGWYGLKKALHGRFGMYVHRLLEEDRGGSSTTPRNNRMRAI